MVDVKQQEQHWNKVAKKYDTFYGYDKPLHQRKIERKANLMISYGRIDRFSKVLELGCGTGAYTKFLVETKATVTASDLSAEMIKIASKKYPTVSFFTGDSHKLCFKDNTFDAVIGAYILQYLDIPKVFTEIHRVLRPGGRVCFVEPNELNPLVFFFSKLKMTRYLGRPEFSNSFNRWQFKFQNFHLNVWPIEPRFLEELPVLREICGSLVIEGYVI